MINDYFTLFDFYNHSFIYLIFVVVHLIILNFIEHFLPTHQDFDFHYLIYLFSILNYHSIYYFNLFSFYIHLIIYLIFVVEH